MLTRIIIIYISTYALGADLLEPREPRPMHRQPLAFLPALQGEIHHKNLWSVDLESGVTSQLTNLPTNFDVRDFDMAPDGREVILERAQVNSQVVVIDRAT